MIILPKDTPTGSCKEI